MKKLLLILALLPLPAFAQGSDCEDANSTVEMVECLNTLQDAVDNDLEQRLDYLRADMTASRAGALDAAQAVWEAFRRLECRSQSLIAEGGTLASVLGANCYLQVTRERLVALGAYDF